MTDIVERLRDISPGPSAELDMLGREAADEIERLRAALRDVLSYIPYGRLPVTIYDNALAALHIVDLDFVLAPPRKDSWV